MIWNERAQLGVLAALAGLFAVVWYFRNQLGVVVADYAEKYWPLPSEGEPYRDSIKTASLSSGVPFDLLARQLWQESRFNATATNPSGASGIAQLIPRFYPGVDVFDPAQAISAQASSMSDYYSRFGTWPKALAAYNWGPGNVDKTINTFGDQWLYHAPTETRKYVGQILTDVPVEPIPDGALV